jgi:hypothetical protein
MPLTGSVLYQYYVALAKSANTIAIADIYLTFENTNILSSGTFVVIHEPITGGEAKKHSRSLQSFRVLTAWHPGVLHGDVNVLKMRFTILSGVNAGHFHV